MIDVPKGISGDHVYSEADWNPAMLEEAVTNPAFGYRASKTFAERAASECVEKELPGKDVKGEKDPKEGLFEFDNSRVVEVLGI